MNDSQSHSVVQKLRLLAPWVEPRGAALVAPSASALPADFAARLTRPYAVLQAPTAVAYKQWPIAHWRTLVDALLARGLQVVLTGAPSPADRAVVDAVRSGFDDDGRIVDAAGALDLNQVGALLRGARVYIGGDTSITHLAAACDVPVVALYGPIDPRYFGPWPPNPTLEVPYLSHAPVQRVGKVTVLQGTPPCVPCNRAGCEDRNDSVSVCLLAMEPGRVVAEVDRILGESLNDNEPMSTGERNGKGAARRRPVKAVILAGGHGTRLAEETHLKPKPMIEIGGRPILWHIMKIYSAARRQRLRDLLRLQGLRDQGVLRQLLPAHVRRHVRHGAQPDGGAPEERRAVARHAGRHRRGHDDRRAPEARARLRRRTRSAFCFTYGDGVADVDIAAALAFHRAHGKLATVTAVQPPGRFGALELDGARVDGLHREAARRRRLDQRRLLRALAARARPHRRRRDELGGRAADRLARDGELMAYDHTGFWQPMDTLRDKNLLEELWQSGRAPWKDAGDARIAADGVLARQARPGHRPYRLQGRLAGAVAAAARRRGHGLRAAPADRAEPLRGSRARGDGWPSTHRRHARRSRAVARTVHEARPQIVFHLAAQPLVRASYREPLETFATNVMGTAHLLEALRDAGRTCASSSSSRPTRSIDNREMGLCRIARTTPLGGHDPYSASKAAAEIVAASYRERRSCAARHGASRRARAGNVIGGGDWADDRLVPDCGRAPGRANECCACAAPTRVRPWQHVLEPLAGYLRWPSASGDGRRRSPTPATSGRLTDEAATVGDVDRLARPPTAAATGATSAEPARPHEAGCLALDSRAGARRARLAPRWPLARGARAGPMGWYRRAGRRRVGSVAVRRRPRRHERAAHRRVAAEASAKAA